MTDESAFDRGHVVWHEALFRNTGRPWLVLSDERHPFHGREYLVAGITTTERADAIALSDDSWAIGGLPRDSYVSPWFLTTIKHGSIERGVGALSEEAVETVTSRVSQYFGR